MFDEYDIKLSDSYYEFSGYGASVFLFLVFLVTLSCSQLTSNLFSDSFVLLAATRFSLRRFTNSEVCVIVRSLCSLHFYIAVISWPETS